jgi:hypothetical protein
MDVRKYVKRNDDMVKQTLRSRDHLVIDHTGPVFSVRIANYLTMISKKLKENIRIRPSREASIFALGKL